MLTQYCVGHWANIENVSCTEYCRQRYLPNIGPMSHSDIMSAMKADIGLLLSIKYWLNIGLMIELMKLLPKGQDGGIDIANQKAARAITLAFFAPLSRFTRRDIPVTHMPFLESAVAS